MVAVVIGGMAYSQVRDGIAITGETGVGGNRGRGFRRVGRRVAEGSLGCRRHGAHWRTSTRRFPTRLPSTVAEP